MARRELTEREFEQRLREADEWHARNPDPQPEVVTATFDPADRRVVVEFANGCQVRYPLSFFPGTEQASDDALSRILHAPDCIQWELLPDAGDDVCGLLLTSFRLKEWAGRYLGPITLVPPPEPPGVSLWVDDDEDDAPSADERIAAD